MSAIKPIFSPLQMAEITSMAQAQKKTAESVFVSAWKQITKGQRLVVEHGVGKEPRFVQLEFGTDGKNIGGDCTLQNIAAVYYGCYVSSKGTKKVTIQAAKDFVGSTVDGAGNMTAVTSAYIRLIAW